MCFWIIAHLSQSVVVPAAACLKCVPSIKFRIMVYLHISTRLMIENVKYSVFVLCLVEFESKKEKYHFPFCSCITQHPICAVPCPSHYRCAALGAGYNHDVILTSSGFICNNHIWKLGILIQSNVIV